MKSFTANTEFKAFLLAKSAHDVATGLMLLACRKRNKEAIAETMVYFSRDFGSDVMTDWLMDDVALNLPLTLLNLAISTGECYVYER